MRLLQPGSYIITDHCVHYHKYADNMQLHFAMSVDNIAGGLAIFAACRPYRRRQTMVPAERPAAQPGQVGGSNRRYCESPAVVDSSASTSVAGVNLSVVDEDVKLLGVVLDQRLTFHKHVSVVVRSCEYHAQVIRHISHRWS